MKQKLFSIFFVLALLWSGSASAATYNLSFSWTADKVTTSPGNGSYYVFWYDSSGNGDELYQITLNKGYMANGGYVTSAPAITFYLIYENSYNYGSITLPEPGTYTVNTSKSTHGGKQIIDYGTVTRSGKGTNSKPYYNTYSYYSSGSYDSSYGTQYNGSNSLNSKAWYSSVSAGSSNFTSGSITLATSTDGYPYITGTLTTADGNTVNVTIGTAPSYSAGTITATPNNASYGSVTGTAGASAFVSGTNYAGGTSVSLTATPNSGYYFSQWSDGTTANPYNITVNGNKNITAQFVAYSNGGSLGTKTWSCNNSSEGQSSVLQTISSTDIYNIYYTSNGYNPAIQVVLLIPTGTKKLYSGYYGAPAGTYNVWYDNTAGAAQVPSHEGECLGSVQNGAVVSRYYDSSGNAYIFYSGTVTVEPGYAGLYYKFVGKVLRNNTLYDLTAIIGTRNTSADEIGRNYTITDCLVKRTSTNNCFDICIYGNHPYSGTEGGVIQLKNVNLGSNTSIAGTHSFTSTYSNCTQTSNWFVEEGYTSSNGADYIDNPYGNITFTYVDDDASGNPRYTIGISSCHGYYYNSSVISGGYCFNTAQEINQYGYTFSKTMTVRAQNSDGTSLTLTDAPTKYSLAWDANSGTITGGTAAGSYAEGASLTAPTVTAAPTGYSFSKWRDVTNNVDFNGTMPANNVTYTAQWTAKTYTVNLNNQSATTAGQTSVTATYGQVMPSIASNLPAKTGHTFGGYFTETNGGGTKYYNADGTSAANWAVDVNPSTLYAQWTANTYEVSFSAGDGSGTAMENQTFSYDETKPLTGNTYTGPAVTVTYNYNGADGGNSIPSATVNGAFYRWTDGVNTYEDEEEVSNLTTENGATVALTAIWGFYEEITLPSPTKTGYTFDHWEYGEAPIFLIADAGEEFTLEEDVTMTAQWNTVTYNLTYNGLEGATNTNPAETYTIETATITLADPGERAGYNFTGWTCGGEAITEITLGSTGDKTITANWEVALTPEIDLYDNTDGSEYADYLTANAGKKVNVTLKDRTFASNRWHTLSLPFDFDFEDHLLDGRVYTLNDCTVDATNGIVITFLPVSEIVAGQPYLVWIDAAMSDVRFEDVTLTTFTPGEITAPSGDVNFIASMPKIVLTDKKYIFINNNRLYYPKQDGGSTMRAFRAYFEIRNTNGMEYTPQRIRIIAQDNYGRTMEVMELEGDNTEETRKYIEDGILIIERGGVRYDAQGKKLD